MANGSATIQFQAQGVNPTVASIQQVGSGLVGMINTFKSLGLAIQGYKALIDTAIATVRPFYDLTIGANEQLNQSILKSGTVLSQNLKVYKNTGEEVTDIQEKILSFSGELKDARVQLQEDTKELVGVTSAFVEQTFDLVINRFNELQGQTKQFGSDIEGATALASNLTAALSTFGLTDSVQQAQEIRALLSGDINNPDASLPQFLNITKEDFQRAKASGELLDFLNSKLETVRAGNALAAKTVSNELSNIQDEIEIFGKKIGEGFTEILAEDVNEFRTALGEALGQEENIETARELISKVVTIIREGTRTVFQILEAITSTGIVDRIIDAGNTILDEVIRINRAIQNQIERTADALVPLIQGFIKLANLPFSGIRLGNQLKNDIIEAQDQLNGYQIAIERLRGGIVRLNGDFDRSTELVEIQGQFLDKFSKSFDDYKQRITGAGEANKEFREELRKFVTDKELEELTDFDRQGFAEKANQGRLSTLTNLSRAVQKLDIQNKDVLLDNISQLRKAEQNANFSNIAERKQLSKQIQADIKSQGKNTGNLGKNLAGLLNSAQDEIKRLEDQKFSIVGVFNREKFNAQKRQLEREIKEIQEFAKENGIQFSVDEQGFTTALGLKSLGTNFEAIESEFTAAVNGIAEAVTLEGLKTSLGQATSLIEQAIDQGVVSASEARDLLEDLASDNRLTFQERAEAEAKLTAVIQRESEIRQSVLDTERKILQSRFDTGLITESEKALEDQDLTIEGLNNELDTLNARLESLLRVSQGVETQTIKDLRNDIEAKTAELTSQEAQKIVIAYQEGIKEIQRESTRLSQLLSLSQAQIDKQIADAQRTGLLTGSEAGIESTTRQIGQLLEQIGNLESEISQIEAIDPGQSITAQLEKQETLGAKNVELANLQNQVAQSRLSLQRQITQNLLRQIELRAKEATDLKEIEQLETSLEAIRANNREEISDERLESIQTAENIKGLTQDIVILEDKLAELKKVQTDNIDDQLAIDQQIRDVTKQILQTNIQIEQSYGSLILSANELESLLRDTELKSLGLQEKINSVSQQILSNEKARAELISSRTNRELEKQVASIERQISRNQELEQQEAQRAEIQEKINEQLEIFNQAQSEGNEEEAQKARVALRELRSEAKQVGKDVVDPLEAQLKKAQTKVEIEKAKQQQQQFEFQLRELELQSQALDIAKEKAKLENESAILGLQVQKDKLQATKEELKARGLLTSEVETSLDNQINNTDKLIEIQNQTLEQNLKGIDAQKQGLQIQAESIGQQSEFLVEDTNKRAKPKSSLRTKIPVKELTVGSIVKSDLQPVAVPNLANPQTESQLTGEFVGAVKDLIGELKGLKEIGTPENVSTPKEQITVNNNFTSLSDDRAMRRTIGI